MNFHVWPVLMVTVIGAFVTVEGCFIDSHFYTCTPYNPDPKSPCPEPDTCTGECVPIAPANWSDPLLLWFGPVGFDSTPPPCPAQAPILAYEGHTDLKAPFDCPVCQCEPSTGSCVLPSVLRASSTAVCPNDVPGAILTSFAAPDPWDGSCTAQNAIPKGALCNGKPCVASLSIEPIQVVGEACNPVPAAPPVPKAVPPSWGTFARACKGTAYRPCKDPGETCVPAADPLPDAGPTPDPFLTCILRSGGDDYACPSTYPTKHVFYEDFADKRECAACTCDSPVGSQCTASVSIYQNSACTAPEFTKFTIDSLTPLCTDVLPGSALGSKKATTPVYQPGTCQPSGGGVTGTIEPRGVSTFCCRE